MAQWIELQIEGYWRDFVYIDYSDFDSSVREIVLTEEGRKSSFGQNLEEKLKKASGLGLVLMHEFSHAFDFTGDPGIFTRRGQSRTVGGPRGEAVDFVNRIGGQLQLPMRQIYLPQVLPILGEGNNMYLNPEARAVKIPFVEDTMDPNSPILGFVKYDTLKVMPVARERFLLQIIDNPNLPRRLKREARKELKLIRRRGAP